jgi:hypothetical protein
MMSPVSSFRAQALHRVEGRYPLRWNERCDQCAEGKQPDGNCGRGRIRCWHLVELRPQQELPGCFPFPLLSQPLDNHR